VNEINQTGTNHSQDWGKWFEALALKPEGCRKLFSRDITIASFSRTELAEKSRWYGAIYDPGYFEGIGFDEFWDTAACEKATALNRKNLLRPIRIGRSEKTRAYLYQSLLIRDLAGRSRHTQEIEYIFWKMVKIYVQDRIFSSIIYKISWNKNFPWIVCNNARCFQSLYGCFAWSYNVKNYQSFMEATFTHEINLIWYFDVSYLN